MTAAELIERVARLICKDDGGSWIILPETIPEYHEENEYQCREMYRKFARAAVTEMLDAILEQPARGMQAGYSLRARLDALAAEIREGI